MRRGKVILLSLALLASCFPVSCSRLGDAKDVSFESRPTERVMDVPPEPAHGSYGSDLRDASLLLVASSRPELPFPETAIVGTAAVDLLYGEGETRYRFRVYGTAEAVMEVGAARFDFAPPREARRGSSIYRIEGRSLVLLSADSQTEGQAVSSPLRRWDGEHNLVAGPVVFQDRILVATDAPSFVALDRTTFAPVFERPMEALAVGPLVLIEEPRLLAAFHADGTAGLYSLAENATFVASESTQAGFPDPVAAFLDPTPEALAAMEAKTASLMGVPSVHLPPARLHGPRRMVFGEDAILFRTDTEGKGATMRLYLDGAGKVPYLIAAFDAAGSFLKSNIDYTGAEKVLELHFQPGATYYFAVAFLSRGAAAGGEETAGETAQAPTPVARFVIVPKK